MTSGIPKANGRIACQGKRGDNLMRCDLEEWLDRNPPYLSWLQMRPGRRGASFPKGLTADAVLVRSQLPEIEEARFFLEKGLLHVVFDTVETGRWVAWQEYREPNQNNWYLADVSAVQESKDDYDCELIERNVMMGAGSTHRFSQEVALDTLSKQKRSMKVYQYFRQGRLQWWRVDNEQ